MAAAQYADVLRATFPALDPVIDDLLLLEAHEVAELPDRVPARELAAILHARPEVRRFFECRYPPIVPRLRRLLDAHGAVAADALPDCAEAVLWEIADWIVYQRAPSYYDERVTIPWDVDAVAGLVDLHGSRVVDAGAGTGRVALSVAPLAGDVFAVEPVAALRQYLRGKAGELGLANVHVLDGLLRAVPLPSGSVDVLLTCQAVGWHLEAELDEIERLLATGGMALHAFGAPEADPQAPPEVGEALVAHGYVHDTYPWADGLLHRYVRRL